MCGVRNIWVAISQKVHTFEHCIWVLYCLYLIYLQALTKVCASSTRGKCSGKNTPEILACGSAECGNMLVSVEPLLQQQLLLLPAQATIVVLSSWLCV